MKGYFALYQDNGEIVQVVSSSEESARQDAQDLELNIIPIGYMANGNNYVRDGKLVAYPPKPSPAHRFNYKTHEWEITLQDAKDQKWAEIKAFRNSEEFGGFEWNGYVFDSEQISQQRISSAAQLGMINPDYTIEWTLADNSSQVFTGSEMIQIGQALAEHVTSLHERGRILRNQIESATSVAQVEAITWQPTT